MDGKLQFANGSFVQPAMGASGVTIWLECNARLSFAPPLCIKAFAVDLGYCEVA